MNRRAVLLGAIAIAGVAYAEPSADEAAKHGLKVLREVGGGAETPAGVELRGETSLGNPAKQMAVPLDRLCSYQKGQDPSGLLVETPRQIYPVVVGGRTISSITVAKNADNWKPVAYGTSSIETFEEAMRNAGPGGGEQSREIVVIQALNLEFAAMREEHQPLKLVPLQDYPTYALKLGEPVEAETLFEKLKPFARKIDRDKPS
jgi:hypothetical protein